MSVETGASMGAATPSLSGEGFSSSPSISSPSISSGIETGSVVGGFSSIGSLISETSSFSPLSTRPEGPAKMDFSGFETIAKPNINSISPFSEKNGFLPFEPEKLPGLDRAINFDPAEFSVLASNEIKIQAPDINLPDFKDFDVFEPSLPLEETIVFDFKKEDFSEVAKAVTDIKESALVGPVQESRQVGVEAQAQAQKVSALLVETGVYTKEEADERVKEIVKDKDKIKTQKTEASRRIDTKLTAKAVNDNESDDDEDDGEKKKQTPAYIEDDKAQKNRKKRAKDAIAALFEKGRSDGRNRIASIDIAEQLEEKQEDKSELLKQVVNIMVPDGSFDEAVQDIARLGEFTDLSQTGEENAINKVSEVFDSKIAVKLSDNPSDSSASEKDAQRVLKFTSKPKIPTSLAA